MIYEVVYEGSLDSHSFGHVEIPDSRNSAELRAHIEKQLPPKYVLVPVVVQPVHVLLDKLRRIAPV